MGLTKTARAAASTTAEIPRPTVLAGTPLILTSITFITPTVTLTIHNLPSPTAPAIFLEADGTDEMEVRDFLDGCVPDFGDRKYHHVEGEGLQKTRNASQLLVVALRQGGFI
jgi:hypothetical protein